MLRIAGTGWSLIALVAMLAGCGSDTTSDAKEERTSGVNSESDDDEDDDGDTQTRADSGAGSKNDKKDSGASSSRADAGTKAPADSGKPGGDDIPCEVAKVLEAKCQNCHGSDPIAPFSLVTVADFQATLPGESELVYKAAATAVGKTGPGSMPPASADEQLTAEEKKTLTDWLNAGAKGGAACAGGDATPKPDAGSAPAGKGGSGGAHATRIEYDDPMMKCYEFRSYANPASKTQPYSVPTQPDFYAAFNFNPPWQGTMYVRSFRSLVDNSDVIHHWLFFQQGSLQAEGITPNALGAHPDGQMLAGWAPGGSDLYFDPDVAFEVPGDVSYQLEAHYNNKTGSAAPDASGVELCVTPTKPTHVAGLSWVGTDAIAGNEATGRCGPQTSEDIHLIAAQPHMHTKGRHMKVVLQRADGAEEVIHDEPFDFEFQRSYVMDVIIRPGDQLFTTCTYSEFAVFGKGTNDEMCYFFSNYWPKGTLTSLGVGTLIHGVNSCMDI